MSSLSDAVAKATAPYTGWTYYATGPDYYNPTQTATYIEDLNNKFKLNLTPEEITAGITQFGDAHRKQFGYPVSQSYNQQTWVNQNGVGNFTNLSDPFAIARESVGNVLRSRGLPETAVQSNFYAPLQTFSQNSTDTYQKAADGLIAAQRAAWKSQNPDLGGMGFGSIISDLISNPIVLGLTGAAIGASGLLSGLGEAASLGSGISAGASGITGATAGGLGVTGATVGSAAGLGSGAGWAAGLTGNALADKILGDIPAAAARNIATQAVMNDGKVDLNKLVSGVVAGGFGTALNPYVTELGLDPAVTKGITAGTVGTGMGLIYGQDIGTAATGGLINGVATTVGNVAATAAHDATSAGQQNSFDTGAMATALGQTPTGITSSFADVLSPDMAGSIAGTVVGNVTGTVLNSAVGSGGSAPVVDVPPPAVPTPTAAGVSFSDVLPQNRPDPERLTDWTGTRLINAGRI